MSAKGEGHIVLDGRGKAHVHTKKPVERPVVDHCHLVDPDWDVDETGEGFIPVIHGSNGGIWL